MVEANKKTSTKNLNYMSKVKQPEVFKTEKNHQDKGVGCFLKRKIGSVPPKWHMRQF